ncbi:MAG: GreA/GreB family elongation factor [Candidatus Dojkabacteria bacterium]|nr:MAG: GreA/GreB family elongation factor [Candidatus Dojkabacteria bacterium]
MEPILLTQSGIEELQMQVSKLEVMLQRRKASVNRTVEWYGSDDEQYFDRLEIKNETQAELDKYKDILRKAKSVETVTTRSTDVVELGSIVHLVNPDTHYEMQVVSSVEANPLKNKISVDSPIGQAVIGRKVGDLVDVSTPVGKAQFRVDRIS